MPNVFEPPIESTDAADTLPPVLPDDPQALKALLLQMQQRHHNESQRVKADIQAQLVADRAAVYAELKADFDAQLACELAKAKSDFDARLIEAFEQVRLARSRQFGPSSEAHAGQGHLFNEAEQTKDVEPEAPNTAQLPEENTTSEATGAAHAPVPACAPANTKARGKRKPLPADLPRVTVVQELPETERTCACGTPMIEIGEEVSEQLDIIPMQVRVLRTVRKRYACPQGSQAPVIAPLPTRILPKTNASNSLLAMLLAVKYVDGLPLARFEYVLARAGVLVPRQTLARWVIEVSKALQPVANLMRDILLESPVLHMDETTVQVLKEENRSPTSNSYMWVQRGGTQDKPVIMFDYDPSRSQEVPKRLLEGWSGYLMSDGYEAYSAAVRGREITHLGCWAHARRYFMDAIKAMPAGKRSHAHHAVEMIKELYLIEREIKGSPISERLRQRQTRSQAVLDRIRQWLDKTLPQVPRTSLLGKALGYLQGQWHKLIRFVERGDLPLDNNPCENAIRPFVTGRKAWLFSDTASGAHASALIYSLVETAKANGCEPYMWLNYVMNNLTGQSGADHVELLMPWNWKRVEFSTN
jgi:transposase